MRVAACRVAGDRYSAACNVNRACGPLLEKRPVHPGESYALRGTIKYELGWTFLDNRISPHITGMRQKRAVKLANDVQASRGY
jgi:hypothetical protein